MEKETGPANARLDRPAPDTLQLRLSGDWRLGEAPSIGQVGEELRGASARQLTFETTGLRSWDSTLLIFLVDVQRHAAHQGIVVDESALPDGARRLLALASSTPEARGARTPAESASPVALVGHETIGLWHSFVDGLTFLGEVTQSLGRLLKGRARLRRSDLLLTLQEAGPQAFPIVGLLSFLIGLILAYIGATQLERLGAQIYVADLVGIAMAREMAAVMTAIIMAGRTGAAFAAQLGTMQVNEEIDALKTLGLSPIEFLVLPRLLALWIMMPMLYVYSLLMGILGGAVVAVGALDLGALQYFEQTREAMELHHCGVGLVKSVLFGILVALAGCLRGIRSGRSSAAVGTSTTSAVVTAIIWIIATDAILDVVVDMIGV